MISLVPSTVRCPMMQDFITYSAATIRDENTVYRPEGGGRIAFVVPGT